MDKNNVPTYRVFSQIRKYPQERKEGVFLWIFDGYSSVKNPLAGKTIDLCSSTWQN